MSKRNTAWSLIGLLMLSGCGGAEGDSAAAAEERTFAEGVGEDKCAVLTMEDVVAATGLPEDAIEQRKVSGCLYSWDDGTVWMSSVRVHESVDRAKSYYARFTEDVSADEVEPAREQVKDELSEKEESGEITATEGEAGRAITDAMPARDFTHQLLPGIGNEASYDGNGTVWIRWGNLTATFSGKTGDEDRIDPELAAEYGRRVVANLGEM